MTSNQIKQKIVANAEKIRQLHSRLHEAFRQRDESEAKRQEWTEAAARLQADWDRLAFPGGYWQGQDFNALKRILGGDPLAMEAAICFLEVRPYFFRSGYMFKDILRKVKKAPLSEEQSARLATVLAKVEEWRYERNLRRDLLRRG